MTVVTKPVQFVEFKKISRRRLRLEAVSSQPAGEGVLLCANPSVGRDLSRGAGGHTALHLYGLQLLLVVLDFVVIPGEVVTVVQEDLFTADLEAGPNTEVRGIVVLDHSGTEVSVVGDQVVLLPSPATRGGHHVQDGFLVKSAGKGNQEVFLLRYLGPAEEYRSPVSAAALRVFLVDLNGVVSKEVHQDQLSLVEAIIPEPLEPKDPAVVLQELSQSVDLLVRLPWLRLGQSGSLLRVLTGNIVVIFQLSLAGPNTTWQEWVVPEVRRLPGSSENVG